MVNYLSSKIYCSFIKKYKNKCEIMFIVTLCEIVFIVTLCEIVFIVTFNQ